MAVTTPVADPGSDVAATLVNRGALVGGIVVLTLALLVAWVAALGAPQQPELFGGGGACQFAPCGELEDPARWRSAWLAIATSAALAVAGLVLVAAALPARPLRSSSPRVVAGCLMLLVIAPIDVAVILLASSLAPVPFAFVLAATWNAGFGALLHAVLFVSPVSRWSVVVAASACTAPFALLMAWFPLWTLG